jgi:integrase
MRCCTPLAFPARAATTLRVHASAQRIHKTEPVVLDHHVLAFDVAGFIETEAFPWAEAPRYLIRDRDCVYGAAVTHRLRTMGIRDKPIAPGSPWQNGFAERLIGSIRHECVDHLVVLGEARAKYREKPEGRPVGTNRLNSSVRTREYLTTAEIEHLMAAARKSSRYGHRDATMILICYRHGLRASELCDLQ